jgi:flavin reductase (DIM6/NTAB) family NADH-FMN oxidoreductase RutF
MAMAATALESSDPAAVRQRLFRQVMGRFATGVTVVTTQIGGETFGMTANAFMAGSLEPMLCVVSINRKAQMHDRLLQTGRFGVSFLSEEQQHLAAHFGGKRRENIAPEIALAGDVPVLKRAVAAVTADVASTAACGDHTLFVGRVTSLAAGEATRPLLFYGGRYGRISSRSQLADAEPPPEFW